MITFNIINMKHRPDRMLNIEREFAHKDIKLNRIDAVKLSPGYLGCAASHLRAITHGERNNLDFVIVVEDDCIFNNNITHEHVIKCITDLHANLDDWQIFNGGPTFWTIRNELDKLTVTNSKVSDNMIDISWGQTTHFMIYNRNSYNRLIDLFTDPTNHIDLLISQNFTQTTYKHSHLFQQMPDYSDIEDRANGQEYAEYQQKQEQILIQAVQSQLVS